MKSAAGDGVWWHWGRSWGRSWGWIGIGRGGTEDGAGAGDRVWWD